MNWPLDKSSFARRDLAKEEGVLVVIVGETASGKSALAVQLAEKLGGEIVCADSRTVYKGMDIGTAKPSREEQACVKHYCLDLVRPDERFTVADFKRHALVAIEQIRQKGKVPIMVGGTGLYIDAVILDFEFREASEGGMRDELQRLSVEDLQGRLVEKGIALPENDRNPRHLIRALETNGQESTNRGLRSDALVIGLAPDRDTLKERITQRVDAMVNSGLVEEVAALAKQYGWDTEALRAPGYRAFLEYLEGRKTLEEAQEMFAQADLHLAKRQRTWLKRNSSIHWLTTEDKYTESVDLITTHLNK